MTSQLLTADAPRQPRPRWLIKRSRAASVLLIGWLFFWVGGIVLPCCLAFAGSLGDHRTTTQYESMEHIGPVGLADMVVHKNDQCLQAVTAGAPLLGQIFLLPPKTDHTPQLVVVTYFVPLSAVPEFSHSPDLYIAPSLSRIYLRTQRLLI